MSENHLSTATSELPEYIKNNAINVSGFQVGNGAKCGNGIYNEYGSINTGHIPSWKLLLFKDRKILIDERKRLDIRYRGKSGAKSGKRGNSNHAAAGSNNFKRLKKQNDKYKR